MKKAIVVFIICVLAIGTSCKEEVVQINKNVFFPVKMGEMWGLVDTSCNFTLEPVYNCFGEFYQSIALVSKGDRIAYIDENGKLLKPFDFISGTHFSEGLAFVLGTDSAISCIDTAMNIVFALPAVERAEIFEDGLAAVKVGDKFGYIDRSGKNVIPCTFDVVTPFSEGYAAVANFVSIKDSLILKWNYIDKKGKVVIENKFDDALPFHMGKAAVRNENSWEYLNTKGENSLNGKIFDECHSFSNGFAAFCKNQKWGIIRADGKVILEPAYPVIGAYKNGFFPFSLGPESFGYLDSTGKIVIQPEYKAVSGFSKGFAFVVKESKLSIINSNGKIICENRFDSAPGYFGSFLGFVDTPLNTFVEKHRSPIESTVNF